MLRGKTQLSFTLLCWEKSYKKELCKPVLSKARSLTIKNSNNKQIETIQQKGNNSEPHAWYYLFKHFVKLNWSLPTWQGAAYSPLPPCSLSPQIFGYSAMTNRAHPLADWKVTTLLIWLLPSEISTQRIPQQALVPPGMQSFYGTVCLSEVLWDSA